jgi:hypothetical protein
LRNAAKEWKDGWEQPVFILGFSASATGPLISVGNTTGMYFAPYELNDPIFHAAFACFINLITSPNPISKALVPFAYNLLVSRSSDHGVFSDLLSAGTGWSFPLTGSASIGGTIGIFRSMGDLSGFFNETGFSFSLGLSLGADTIFNDFGFPVGFLATIGVGTPSFLEVHSRFGNAFVFPFKN